MSSSKKLLQAAAGNAGESLYVEDVFSTYLYTGTGSAMTITNGIDLSGEGGLVWIKNRDGADDNVMFSPTFGANKMQRIKTDALETVGTDVFQSFNSDGFTHGGWGGVGGNGNDIASWTFRKAEKFFDVVTYSGNGVDNRQIPHNLGSVPGMIIVKSTSSAGQWPVYHQSLGTGAVRLNLTNAYNSADIWWKTTPTDSHFTVYGGGEVNVSGIEYVAYLFASDAGGFGDDGSESIIKCGSYTGTGSVDTLSIELGFEPQWIMVKSTTTTKSWFMQDIMRGMPVGSSGKALRPDTSAAESPKRWFYPTPTGVRAYDDEIEYNQSGQTYIYIAIRRPMKTPESGTEVFNPTTAAVHTDITNNFPADLWFGNNTSGDGGNNAHTFASRLTGLKWLQTATNAAESTASNTFYWDSNTTFTNNQFGGDRVGYYLKRATGFFDVVAYTGNGSAHNEEHNLGVVPELLIFKTRSASVGWAVSCGEAGYTNGGRLELSNQFYSEPNRVTGTPTSTTVPIGTDAYVNVNGRTYIAYLFATLAGVSKVGSYTGTGSNLNVDCGFSAGARFILIKRSDSTGDWYVWDSARGIVAGNDPYLLLNTTAAQVTNTDYIDPLSSGFTVTSSAPAALNASGGTYIFLAIA